VSIRERAEAEFPPIGSVIDGRYELLRDLGRGGAGAVFEARHVYTRRVVAIKIVRGDRDGATIAELKARLLREAHALAAARHPGVVDVLDAGVEVSGRPFLVLERLEGRTLEGLLATRGRISATDTIAIGLQLAECLSAAHRAGIVHRDVKPSNVFLIRDPDGREHTKLVDFGIARLDRPTDRKISLCGALIGTPEYMSPEQLLAKDDIDTRSDVYALGVTLFECVTGTVPYSGHYPQILLQSATTTATPSVRSVAPDVPPGIAAVVDRALAKSRDERFRDMDEFAAALAAIPSTRRQSALLGPPPLPAAGPVAAAEVDSPPVDYAQRRRAERTAYVTPVRLTVDGKTLDGRIEDISEGGLLVLFRGDCPADGPVDVRFASPIDGKDLALSGWIRWVKEARHQEHGVRAVGIELDALPPEVRASIQRYSAAMGDPPRTPSTLD